MAVGRYRRLLGGALPEERGPVEGGAVSAAAMDCPSWPSMEEVEECPPESGVFQFCGPPLLHTLEILGVLRGTGGVHGFSIFWMSLCIAAGCDRLFFSCSFLRRHF